MMAVFWNPAIRKSVGILVPSGLHLPEGLTFIGFGGCPNPSDPKLVKINTIGFRTVDWEVCVGGFVYWLAYDNVKLGDGFRVVHTYDLRVTKVKDSLGLLENYDDGEIPFCGVWILKDGVTKSFAKMFSVKLQSEWIGLIAILDFTKDGKAIRLKYVDDDYMPSCVLSAYEENGKGVGIPGRVTLFAAKSYMETMLLLDQSNSFVY
uniref:F-box associated domain-containing protein n=2 Tax=Tanacetum cinerariifolium TaxID=118510 RepID=A0A699IYV6_TANCI|nr:hypothetical protein [Tanacetum cinerariifolium]